MISKRPDGAITSRSAATIGAILATSLRAGSTTEKSGGRAAIARAMFGNPPQLTALSRESVHCRRYHPVDCIESNRTIIVVYTISHSFPQMFNLELQCEAAAGMSQPARAATSRWKHTSITSAGVGLYFSLEPMGASVALTAPSDSWSLCWKVPRVHPRVQRTIERRFCLTASFRRDAGRLDEGPPFFQFGLLQGAERLRCLLVRWKYFLTKLGEPRSHRGLHQGRDHGSVEP